VLWKITTVFSRTTDAQQAFGWCSWARWSFAEPARTKIRHYRQLYNNHPDPITFMSVSVDTSGRVYDDLSRLLFLHAHREVSVLSNEIPEESELLRSRPCILRIKTWQRILRDSLHGCTVSGEQRDRSVDMQLQVDVWRCRPASLMRTEKHSHLVCCSWLSSKNDDFTRILDDAYEPWCTPTKNTRSHRQHRCFWFLALSWQCILTHSVTQDGLARTRNTNLSALASENMWYQHILIELLVVQLLLQPYIHISTCSSLHSSKRKKDS
jgi:hypothetical protein